MGGATSNCRRGRWEHGIWRHLIYPIYPSIHLSCPFLSCPSYLSCLSPCFHLCICLPSNPGTKFGWKQSAGAIHWGCSLTKPKVPLRVKETVAVDLSFDCIEGWRLLGVPSHYDGVLCIEIHVHVYIWIRIDTVGAHEEHRHMISGRDVLFNVADLSRG